MWADPRNLSLRDEVELFPGGSDRNAGDRLQIAVDDLGGDRILQVLLDLTAEIPGPIGLAWSRRTKTA